MSGHEKGREVLENVKKTKLRLLAAGYAEVDVSWKNTVINSPYSRIYFVLEGSFYIISPEGERFLFEKGNAYLVPTGYSYEFGCNDFAHQVYFHLQLTTFDRIDILGEFNRPVSIPLKNRSKNYYIDLALSKTLENSLLVQAEIYSLISDILLKTKVLFKGKDYSAGVTAAINYIRDNLSLQLTISDIAEKAHLATSTLTRNFKNETGLSVGEYIDSLIMFSAEQKLMTGEMSVLEISELYGFCDQFYFSRKFREKYGLSPSQYRKRPTI